MRVTEPLTVIPIRDQNEHINKGYKGDSNYRYDVWEMPDGKWEPEVVSTFDAHQPHWMSAVRAENSAARKVLSLHQGDVLAIEREGEGRKLMIVTQFWQNGQVRLVERNEAGKLEEISKSDNDPYKN